MFRNKISYILIAFASIIIVSLAGNTYSNSLKNKSIKGVHNKLISIATLKIDNISNWYIDELEDAQLIAQNIFLSELIFQWNTSQSYTDSVQLVKKLQSIKNEHGYEDIYILVKKNGVLDLHFGSKQFVPHKIHETAELVLESISPSSTDLYYNDNDDGIYLDFISPINDNVGELFGLIGFRMNPNDFLFPLIQNWPVPSQTAETAIFRKTDDSIIYLNNLRHIQNTALKLALPLSRTEISAVKGGMGFNGITEGLDYRNVEVVSYVSEIPETPWFIVAEVDKAEIYEGITDQTRLFNLLLILILLLVFSSLAFLYSNTQKNTFKSLWLAQEEFKTTLYCIGDAVITTDKKGIVTHLNPVAEKLTGWKENEALGLPADTVFHIISEVTSQKIENPVTKVIREGKIVGLANHTLLISKNGDQIPIADSGAPIIDDESRISGVVLVFRDQTEERQHQMVIEEQRRRLFTLMSNLPGMVYRCKNDEFWTMEFVSKGCFQLLGYHDYELENNKRIAYGELIFPEDKEYVFHEVEEALQNNTNFEIEYRIKDRNDKLKWVWERGQAIVDELGNIVAIEGFISDITIQKQIQANLKSSEHLFHTLAINAGVGIFKTNKKGLTTFTNPKYCELVGLNTEEALGLGWLKYLHPDDRKEIEEKWSKALTNQSNSKGEYRFVHPNGKTIWVKGQVNPDFSNNGELLGYVGTITDITDQVNAEETINHQIKLFNIIIENIPDAVYMKDTDGRKIIANKADITNCGASTREEIIGKNDFDLFPKEIAEGFWIDDQRVLKHGEVILNRIEKLQSRNGEIKWLNTSKIPFKDENGKILGLVGIGHNITEKKVIQEELLVALQKAEESDRLKTSFLANMSHEIRTPLNSILGFTNILEESDDLTPQERSEYSTIIRKSANSLLQIINDIIDISSLETGQLKIFNSNFDVNHLIDLLHREFIHRAGEMGKDEVEIRKTEYNENTLMFSDQNRINQIFINLLTNAMKFTQKGHIEFGIVNHDEKNIYFKVQDTGYGIPEAMREIVFERFRQGDEKNTRNFGGNGLGLSIVKNLIELMGGKIWLDSEEGVGSCFNFYLPKSY